MYFRVLTEFTGAFDYMPQTVLPIRHIDFAELCDRDLFLSSWLNHRNLVSYRSLFIVCRLYWRYVTTYIFTVKNLHLLQVRSYFHRFKFRVYKLRKDLKPALYCIMAVKLI